MNTRSAVLVVVAGALIAIAGLACVPETTFNDAEIKQVKSYSELMYHLATQADPQFAIASKRTAATITPEEIAAMGAAAGRMKAAADRLDEPAFSKGPGYNKLAGTFRGKVQAMAEAGASKDGARAIKATLDVKATCAACHAAHR
jgi:hypothetical protein